MTRTKVSGLSQRRCFAALAGVARRRGVGDGPRPLLLAGVARAQTQHDAQQHAEALPGRAGGGRGAVLDLDEAGRQQLVLYARPRRVRVRRLDHLDPAAGLGLSVPVSGASEGSGCGVQRVGWDGMG